MMTGLKLTAKRWGSRHQSRVPCSHHRPAAATAAVHQPLPLLLIDHHPAPTHSTTTPPQPPQPPPPPAAAAATAAAAPLVVEPSPPHIARIDTPDNQFQSPPDSSFPLLSCSRQSNPPPPTPPPLPLPYTPMLPPAGGQLHANRIFTSWQELE